ncbi:MAG: protein-tyrosine phosphatase family protein [Spirochaetia bacterium]|nr:protein-tyrosine phosphatase family protein [Spirochaetia bacterium]
MAQIDRLALEGLHDMYLSSHPLEEVQDSGDVRSRVEAFIGDIKARGVGTVVVLLPSHEIDDLYGDVDLVDEYRKHGLGVVHFPLENFTVPDKIELFDELIARLVGILGEQPILVHCMAGCGRTGLIAAGVLVRHGSSATEAIEVVRNIRHGSMDMLRQVLFLRSYRRYIDGRKQDGQG